MMKLTMMTAVGALLLAACGGDTTAPDAPAPETPVAETVPSDTPEPDELTIADTPQLAPDPVAYYDETIWDIAEGWPGEYPGGFSTIEDGVVLKARAEMTPYSPQDIDCPVPKMATYQQWNGERNKADTLEWRSATQTFPITITEELLLEGENESGPAKINLAPGDTITYLRYYGEGFIAIRHDGTEYGVDSWPLQETSDFQTAGLETADIAEWVQMPCADGKRGWVLYDEALTTDGVVVTPITGYGESSDLTEETLKQAIEQAAAQEDWKRMEAEDAAKSE